MSETKNELHIKVAKLSIVLWWFIWNDLTTVKGTHLHSDYLPVQRILEWNE